VLLSIQSLPSQDTTYLYSRCGLTRLYSSTSRYSI